MSPSRQQALSRPLRGLLLLSLLVLALAGLSVPAFGDSSFGRTGTGAGEMEFIRGVAEHDGKVYVAEPSSQRIDEYETDGEFVRSFGWGVIDNAEEFQICTSATGCTIPTHTNLNGTTTSRGGAAGQFSQPELVQVEPSTGDLYVLDAQNHRVQKFDSEGHFILAFGGDVVGSGPDNSSNDEIQEYTVVAASGTFFFEMKYPYCNGCGDSRYHPEGETGSLPFNASADEVESALNALPTISEVGGSVTVTGGPGDPTGSHPYVVTFHGGLGGDYVPLLTLRGTDATQVTAVQANVGGAPEVCRAAQGDLCKGGTQGSGAGEFEQVSDGSVPYALGGDGISYVGGLARVQKFASDGTYLGQLSLPGTIPMSTIGVDPEGNIFVHRSESFNQTITEVPGIQEFNSSGALLRTFDESGHPLHFAVGDSGRLYVAEFHQEGESDSEGTYEFREYTPTGQLLAIFSSPEVRQLRNVDGNELVGSIAVDEASGDLIAPVHQQAFLEEELPNHIAVIDLPQEGPPRIANERATDLEPQTATLRATVNPAGHDTHYYFEYLTQHDFETDGGFSSSHVHKTQLGDLGLIIHDEPAIAAISGLEPVTKYDFRVVAESECEPEAHPAHICEVQGPTEAFESAPPVGIRDLTTQTVGPELVKLKAELEPNGGTGGSYTIKYGSTTAYEGGVSEGRLPVIFQPPVKVSATFTDLRPNTTYHYQLSARNSYGSVSSEDRTFTTEQSAAELREAENCPNNASLREQSGSLALPECRAYEMVSPTDKAGYGVEVELFGESVFLLAPDGRRVTFGSSGVFAGAVQSHGLVLYVAERTPSGWHTESTLSRPSPELQPFGPQLFNEGLTEWVFGAEGKPNFHAPEGTATLFLGSGTGSYRQAAPTISTVSGAAVDRDAVVGQSADLRTLVIPSAQAYLASDERPDGGGGLADRLYEVTGAGTPSQAMSLLAEVPLTLPRSGCGVDDKFGQDLNSVSEDGSVVFYDLPIARVPGQQCQNEQGDAGNPSGLYFRVNEDPPVLVSTPPSAQCSPPSPCAAAEPQSAYFYGASPTASLAWFTTEQPLVNSDVGVPLKNNPRPEGTMDLYVAHLEGGQVQELVRASGGDGSDPAPGGNPGLQGVVRVSRDGTHGYFVATAVLTTELNSVGERATEGADNLYGFDATTDETKFVARLCSGPEATGIVTDPACGANLNTAAKRGGSEHINDRDLWNNEAVEAQVTANGRYLIFSSYAQLTPNDTDTAKDVYRYDFSTGRLTLISVGHDGNDGNGNDDAFNAHIRVPNDEGKPEQIAMDDVRAITEDGSTVLFVTKAPLVSRDTNESSDLYEWHEGEVSLISNGLSPQGVSVGMIDPSGDDITFGTNSPLVPSDHDEAPDVYDARIDGGFPVTHAEAPCGSLEACRGALPAAPAPPVNGTDHFVSAGNGAQHLKCAKGRVRVRRHGQIRCVKRPARKPKHRHRKHQRAGGKR